MGSGRGLEGEDLSLVAGCAALMDELSGVGAYVEDEINGKLGEEELVAKLKDDEMFGPLLSEKLSYYPTVTREPFRNRGRITDLISSGQLFNDIGQQPLDLATDRIMMCGSPALLEELKQMFEAHDFVEGSHTEPGHFVIEKAFVER